MEYKKIEVREINGCKVTSKTLVLSEDEKQERLSRIKSVLMDIASERKAIDKTA
jgi:hypothetical protein